MCFGWMDIFQPIYLLAFDRLRQLHQMCAEIIPSFPRFFPEKVNCEHGSPFVPCLEIYI